MNIFHEHYLFLKNEAELLLKHAQESGDSQAAALGRFRRLETLARLLADNPKATDELQLKHALTVIAVENGYESWVELKSALDAAAETSPLAKIADQFYPNGKALSAFWNNWFANYKKAKLVHRETGGFLLPFRNQFFICEPYFVDEIGLPSSIPEWKEIGFDWVHPENVRAWLHLNDRYATLLKKRAEKQRETATSSEKEG
jgi:hypothetical protein